MAIAWAVPRVPSSIVMLVCDSMDPKSRDTLGVVVIHTQLSTE